MVKFEIKIVLISDIVLNDFFFKITTRKNIKHLLESIYYIGMLNYPYLLKINNSYRIVSGFRRIIACFCLKNKYIKVKVLNTCVSLEECAKIAITENSFNRKLNIVELSRIYNLLNKFRNKKKNLLALKKLSKHFPSLKSIKNVGKICLLDIDSQKLLIKNTLSSNIVFELKKIKFINKFFFLKLIDKIKITTNLQKKILKFISEISLRNKTEIFDIFYERNFLKIINCLEPNNKLIKKLRFYLRKRRFPNTIYIISNFYDKLIKTRLSKNSNLKIPVFSNKNSCTLISNFVNLKELLILKKDIDKLLLFFNFFYLLK